jgi:threonine/homoserine/homoserine lactone efflux protein
LIDLPAIGAYTFVMSITPGPNNVMLTASGVNFGFRRTLPHMAGISLGFASQAMLISSGLGVIFMRAPQVQTWLAWVGAVYLAYMGWRLLGAGSVGKAESTRPLRAWEAAGFQFVNPKAWVMALTVGVMFSSKSMDWAVAMPAVFLVLVAINFPCLCVWTAFGSGMRGLLEDRRRRLVFNAVMAVLLVATGVMMVWA